MGLAIWGSCFWNSIFVLVSHIEPFLEVSFSDIIKGNIVSPVCLCDYTLYRLLQSSSNMTNYDLERRPYMQIF